ncbi:hypothetical protein [Sphingomonas sp. YL-JM2C]
MADQKPLIRAEDGGALHVEIVKMVQFLHEASRPLFEGASDVIGDRSKLMSAAATFAGAIFGELIIAGVVTDQDKRRGAEVMARNFRSGIDAGKRMALRVATEKFGGHA